MSPYEDVNLDIEGKETGVIRPWLQNLHGRRLYSTFVPQHTQVAGISQEHLSPLKGSSGEIEGSLKGSSGEIEDYVTGSIYKAISKALAERLKIMLPKLISNHQSGFIKSRQITDSILIANECLDSRIKEKKPGIICKVDLEKAFDHVKWSFVYDVLLRMGFGDWWRTWIKGCIENVPFSILVNGSSHDKFSSQRGLRQGDPLSSFLFLLVSEVLNIMFEKASALGLLGGFFVANNGTKVTHLQFAEDTLVFMDASVDQIQPLKHIFLVFQYASGLPTNFFKCRVFGVGEVSNINELAEVFGCTSESLPAIYLGMPLGDNSRSAVKWERIIELCKNRLANWKKRFLSKAGKLTLVKSVLLILPVYYFSLFMAPKSVIKKIEKVIRSFLWDGCNGERNTSGSSGLQFVGNGETVRFWEDQWLHEGILSSLYPNLYQLSTLKGASIKQCCSTSLSSFSWDLGVSHRRLYDIEIEELSSLLLVLQNSSIDELEEDVMIWKNHKSGLFTVASAYELEVGDTDVVSFPKEKIWSTKWPHKVGFFLWQAALGRLPTLDNLLKRGSALTTSSGNPQPNICKLCDLFAEDANHLLLTCPFAVKVWHYFLSSANFTGSLQPTVLEVLKNWKSCHLSSQAKELWDRLPASIEFMEGA
ncbi:uncharacterized protein LOC113311876 [Papaver somniferum]|uniref:uncharacterized protein LOC113311876 n=1 Tax=Papaver somniferum TaxID=3469 RepID=UPI000E6F8CA8|nr:uncharacterized protein LOC113311876 [Papaver somniferum]